ncbi:N-acetylneuraminate lyase-like isoform X1 [Argonauta hians]
MDSETDPSRFWITGVINATSTPLLPNGDIDFSSFDVYIDFLLRSQVDNIFVNGTTGEGMALTIDERKLTAVGWINAARGKIKKVILHVGAANLKSSIELAKHAEAIGADAIACMCPTFYKPKTEEILVDYLSQVAATAPSIPFFYYSIPHMTNVHLDEVKILQLAMLKIPTLHGMKDCTNCLSKSLVSAHLDRRKLQVIIETPGDMLPCLSIGIPCLAIPAYMAPIYHRMKNALEAGDCETAQRDQLMAVNVVKITSKHNDELVSREKAMLSLFGMDLGPPRLPLVSMSEEKKIAMKIELEEFGFLFPSS